MARNNIQGDSRGKGYALGGGSICHSEGKNAHMKVCLILNVFQKVRFLSRPIHIECQSKHNYIYVIYKVLVYVKRLNQIQVSASSS